MPYPKDPSHPSAGQHQPWDKISHVLVTSRSTQALGHHGPCSQLCQELATFISSLITALRPLGPVVRPQDMALSASGPALAPGPGFPYQWVETNPGICWTLTPPNSEPALALGTPGFCSQPPPHPVKPTSDWQFLHKEGPGNQQDWDPTKPTIQPTVVCSPQQKYTGSPQRGHP